MKIIRLPLLLAVLLATVAVAAEGNGKIGLGLGDHEGKIEVVLVAPGSPAAKAGLAPGMTVEKIDGVKTAGKSLHECATLVHGAPGTTVILELMKLDDPTPVTAALKRE
jgi:carboxyl-terminal processing protease